ncbi:MAG: aminopeptidase P family protein [Acidobacteria bacterium]|nr:MAG: aminopeptidase P family protein [Acidobacteriota bacterium]
MDHPRRLKTLQRALTSTKADALLITHLPNVRYLSGFSGSAGALVITQRSAAFFSDGRYGAQARAEVRGARVVIAKKPPLVAAAEWLTRKPVRARQKPQTLGVEAEHFAVAERSRLAGLLGAKFRITEAPGLLEQQRMVKDEDEIKVIRKAVLMGAALFDTALAHIRPGVAESEVAAEMEYAARKAGADGMSFETIIAAGGRSALPHGRASLARIPRAGFVVCDFGVILAGYCSDMTRTVYVGHPSREAAGFYQAVRDAQQAALEAVRPGVTAGEVDHAARNVLKKSGVGRYFTHSTGHGVGLEIHEAPRVASGQREVLRPGMVITIEPGAYVPGKWGVRIEDMVVVTEGGCEVLTPTSKELISI